MINWLDAPTGGYCLASLDTVVGSLWVIYAGSVLAAAEFGEILPSRYAEHALTHRARAPKWVKTLFDEAFAGEPRGCWSAINPGLTSLERALISQATEIPYGTTCSYGTLAAWAGFPGRARAAGRAMSRSPVAYLIPTHRVVRADGRPAPCQRNAIAKALRLHEHIAMDV